MLKIGTSNYRSEREARQAYGSAYEVAIAEGRITVGKPEIKPGQKLLIDSAGRYHIEEVQPRKFRITFNGRECGALGITYRITKDVEAPDEKAARLKLYDTHEHILVATVEDITGQ